MDDTLRGLWGACCTIALTKRGGGYRPISMGDVARRVAGRAALHRIKDTAAAHFRGDGDSHCLQLGCFSRSGSEHAIHDITLHLQLNPSHIVIHVDVANAFNSQQRFAFLMQVAEHFPELFQLACQFYMEPTDLLVWGTAGADGTQPLQRLLSTSGQQQGDTLGSFLFAIGTQPILQAVHAAHPNVLMRAICDDVHLVGAPEEVAAAFVQLRDGFAEQKLTLKYGPTKTCCWTPEFASAGPADMLRAAEAHRACILPREITRLWGGMKTLGSFIGTDAYVAQEALNQVDCNRVDEDGNKLSPESIRNVCDALTELAASACKNACDIAGHLLRTCVTAKISYLTRTVRPDLLRAAAQRADELLGDAFCKIYGINPGIFAATASPRDKLAATRIHLPMALKGCGLRSAVATSETAYFSSWRAAAQAIASSSSPAARAALSFAAVNSPAFPPALAAVARTSARFSLQLPDLRADLDLALFATCEPPQKLQHIITQAAESDLLASAVAAANLSTVDKAHFNGCDGRWIQASRVRFSVAGGMSQQLTCDQARVRMQRYLRQPLAALAPFVGLATPGTTNANEAIVVDALGDNLLGGYNAVDDAEWTWQHNAVRDCLRACATCSGITTAIEQGKRRDDNDARDDADDDIVVTSNGKRHGGFPGDLELRGDHGYVPAGDNNVWTDIVITTGTCK